MSEPHERSPYRQSFFYLGTSLAVLTGGLVVGVSGLAKGVRELNSGDEATTAQTATPVPVAPRRFAPSFTAPIELMAPCEVETAQIATHLNFSKPGVLGVMALGRTGSEIEMPASGPEDVQVPATCFGEYLAAETDGQYAGFSHLTVGDGEHVLFPPNHVEPVAVRLLGANAINVTVRNDGEGFVVNLPDQPVNAMPLQATLLVRFGTPDEVGAAAVERLG